jgi:hypothetical protein
MIGDILDTFIGMGEKKLKIEILLTSNDISQELAACQKEYL